MSPRRSNATRSTISLPASILDRSRMSDRMRRQRVGRVADLLDVLQPPAVVDLGRARQLRQAHQRVERRADLVAGVGQERALGAVGGLGLVARAGQRLLDDAPLGDVLGQPDRAAGRLRRIERLGQQPAGEGAAVAAHHRHLEVDLLAARQRRAHLLAHRVERVVRRPHHALLLVLQRAARPAEHLVEARVGHHDAAVARERDAHQRVLEDRLALAPRLLAGGDVARAGHLVVDVVDREARGRHQHRHAAPVARGHRGGEVLHGSGAGRACGRCDRAAWRRPTARARWACGRSPPRRGSRWWPGRSG